MQSFLGLESTIEPETLQAYLETDYRVDTDQSFILRLDEYSAALCNLYKSNRVDSCVFITAYNPYGQVLSNSANAKRNDELAYDLKNSELKYFLAEGKHPTGNWRGESSYLILGLTLEEAIKLGNKYQQNAIVWCGSDLIPRLVLLR
jgi:hypothetical protein